MNSTRYRDEDLQLKDGTLLKSRIWLPHGNGPWPVRGYAKCRKARTAAEPNKEAMPDVNVDLSEDIKAAESEAMMRQAKVQEMRSAIEEGRFPLDAKKIAENFAELEKLL